MNPQYLLLLLTMTLASSINAEDKFKHPNLAKVSIETPAQCAKRQDKPNPVECYEENSLAFLRACGYAISMTIRKKEKGFYDCVSAADNGWILHPFYMEAEKALSRNPTLRSFLRDAYARWISIIPSLLPGDKETAEEYDARLRERVREYREAIWRLNLEIMAQ
jgi:hypothetical protein